MDRFALVFALLCCSSAASAASAWLPGFTENGVTHIFERTPTGDTFWYHAPADSPYAGAGGPVRLQNTATGTPISSKVGAVAGNGTAANVGAYASKVAVPVGASGQRVLTTAKQILTLPKIATAARAVSRVTTPLMLAGALYDYFQKAKVVVNGEGDVDILQPPAPGNYLTPEAAQEKFPNCGPPNLPVSANCGGGQTIVYSRATWTGPSSTFGPCSSTVCAQWTGICPYNNQRSGYSCGGWNGTLAPNQINPGTINQNPTDAEIEYQFENTIPDDPPGVVKGMADHGIAPEGGPTIIEGPATQPGGTSTKINPDGSKQVTNTTYNFTYNNNTVNVTQTDVTQNYDAAGQPVGSPITTTRPPDSSPEIRDQAVQARDLCADHPEILACDRMGSYTPPNESILQKNIDVAVTPVEMAGGSCPGDIVLQFMGSPLVISWEPVCSFATQIRFIVIAMAWVTAAFIVVSSPGLRGGGD